MTDAKVPQWVGQLSALAILGAFAAMAALRGPSYIIFLLYLAALFCGLGAIRSQRAKLTRCLTALAAILVIATVPLHLSFNEVIKREQTAPVSSSVAGTATPQASATAGAGSPVVSEGVRPGWGPARELFTMENPSTFVTMNSIIDNPEVGDERHFFVVRNVYSASDWSSVPSGEWHYSAEVRPGDHLFFRVYVENSIANNLDDEGQGTIDGLKLRVHAPRTIGDVKSGDAGQNTVSAVLSASNTEPSEIWSTVVLSAPEAVTLSFVQGSASISSNAHPDGLPIPGNLLTEDGLALGYDRLDGRLRAGMKYALYLTFLVKAS